MSALEVRGLRIEVERTGVDVHHAETRLDVDDIGEVSGPASCVDGRPDARLRER